MKKNKIYITENQFLKLLETYNYHFSGGKDIDLKNIKPYSGNETRVNMTPGRDTGHFGTGTYFSTYDFEPSSVNGLGDEISKEANFVKVKDGIYRVNFSQYPNLYKCLDENTAKNLFNYLKSINNVYNGINGMDSNYMFAKEEDRYSIHVDEIFNRAIQLGNILNLDTPSLEELKKISKNLLSNDDRRTLATFVMEYNGYNGVDVTHIPEYDNTLHGSVIYNLNNKNPRYYFTVNGEFVKYINDIREIKYWLDEKYKKCITVKELNYIDNSKIDVYIGNRKIGDYDKDNEKLIAKK